MNWAEMEQNLRLSRYLAHPYYGLDLRLRLCSGWSAAVVNQNRALGWMNDQWLSDAWLPPPPPTFASHSLLLYSTLFY